jgi:hypothetical protein
MSDEVLTIKLTEREIDLLHQCISTNMETVKRRHDPSDPMIGDLLAELGELSDDLLEQLHNRDEEAIEGRSFSVVENDFIDHGIRAREMQKESSRAAARRNFNLKGPNRKLSATQCVDVWNPDDPTNW